MWYHEIDPVLLKLGPLRLYWYSLAWLLGFALAWYLAVRRTRRPDAVFTAEEATDLILYAALGLLLGGRLGYVLFYEFIPFLHDPLMLVRVWHGGTSFHGALLGAALAFYLYARRLRKDYFALTDFIVTVIPATLFMGRLGDFINGDLWGRVTDLPWGVVFQKADLQPRHPAQLYEALFEGVLLFVWMQWLARRPQPRMALSAWFVLGYGVLRFFTEFFRAPDEQIGFVAWGWLTMGQLLSIPMVFTGLVMVYFAYYGTKEAKTA